MGIIYQFITMKQEFKTGELCFCWYPTSLNAEGTQELDLFYCKIKKLGEQYCTCEIYYGEDEDKLRLRGEFEDVCAGDLVKIQIK